VGIAGSTLGVLVYNASLCPKIITCGILRVIIDQETHNRIYTTTFKMYFATYALCCLLCAVVAIIWVSQLNAMGERYECEFLGLSFWCVVAAGFLHLCSLVSVLCSFYYRHYKDPMYQGYDYTADDYDFEL